MKMWCGLSCGFLVICLHFSSAQLPPRPLQIPGSVLVQGGRPAPLQPQRGRAPISLGDFGPRPRRPIALAASPPPIRDIRPVVEEEDDQSSTPLSAFDAEVNKLGISALQSAVRQASTSDDTEEPTLRPSTLPFRPERPVPVTRDQIRESRPFEASSPRPSPSPITRPLPVLRQEPRQVTILQQSRPSPRPAPRPVVRQEIDEEDDEESGVRQPLRQKVRQQAAPIQQQFRPAQAPRAPRPQYDDDGSRKRKPPVQILRKYRTDNADGSITWGYENEDGTFKEETLGVDCVTRGKYGYFDPDGVKREFTYETGNKCELGREPEIEEEEEVLAKIPPKKPQNFQKPQAQFRPQPTQFSN